jgi:hypothetical protein
MVWHTPGPEPRRPRASLSPCTAWWSGMHTCAYSRASWFGRGNSPRRWSTLPANLTTTTSSGTWSQKIRTRPCARCT